MPKSWFVASGAVPSWMKLHAEEQKAEPEDRLTDVAQRCRADTVHEPAAEDESGESWRRSKASSWTVTVVPISAPRIMPIVWRSVRRPADAKPTSMTVVALDDCSPAVTPAPQGAT